MAAVEVESPVMCTGSVGIVVPMSEVCLNMRNFPVSVPSVIVGCAIPSANVSLVEVMVAFLMQTKRLK